MARTKAKPAPVAVPNGARQYRAYYGTVCKGVMHGDDMEQVMRYCNDRKISWNKITRID